MLFDDTYYTLKSESRGEYRDRGSRFIAYALPVESEGSFKHRLAELRKEHPQAGHHCYAFRLGTDPTSYRSSDDREPAGSAGKPILGVLQSNNLSNAAIVVVRYFGGTLLGVPGLINAYRSAAQEAINHSEVIEKFIEVKMQITFPYSLLNEIYLLLRQSDCHITGQDQEENCTIRFSIRLSKQEELILKHKKHPRLSHLSQLS